MTRAARGHFGLALLILAGCSAAGTSAPRAVTAKAAPPAPAPAHEAEPAIDGGPGVAFANVFLGHVVVEREAPGAIGGRGGARLTIDGELGGGNVVTKEMERRGLKPVRRADRLELVVTAYPARNDPPSARERAASFVIDFDTDAVRRVRDELARQSGESPTMRDVTRFVATYIEKKNLTRGYDIASVVARRREGDCSEHAVLLAALGRSFGFSTRVVHGIVFVDQRGSLLGAQHAWVEWHDGKTWAPADGAIGEEHDPLYLPLQALEDESPAFGRDLFLGASYEIRRVTLAPAHGS